MMNNWKYFTIQELCASETALRNRIENVPDCVEVKNLNRLVEYVLDPLRELWGSPIIVTSGFRCNELNEMVGGVSNSYHTLGLAADIIASSRLQRTSWVNNFGLIRIIEQNKERWGVDKVIAERSSFNGCEWVHVQIPRLGEKPRYRVIYS